MTRPPPPSTDLLIGLGAAAVLAAGLMASRGELVGLVTGGLAAFGLLVRWGSAPPLVMLAAAYFSLFPDGLPVGRGPDAPPVRLQLLDLLNAGAAVAYAAGHYRYAARTTDAGEEPTPEDLGGLFVGVAAAVVVAAAAFLLTTLFQPDYDRGTLRLARVPADAADPRSANHIDPVETALSRAVLLLGLLGGGALLAGLSMWLVRLNRLTAAEARQLLLDTRWQEARRELARLETWRAAARQPASPRPRRRPGCVLAVGLALFAAAFLVGMWLLNRYR